jgi:hypothetical protein
MAAVRYFVPIRQALEAPSLQETLSVRYHRDTDVDVGETPPMKTLQETVEVLLVCGCGGVG